MRLVLMWQGVAARQPQWVRQLPLFLSDVEELANGYAGNFLCLPGIFFAQNSHA